MNREIVKDLTFVTPAFLAGADQNKPEIRAPSIRGALRWWFRVLGGSPDEEDALFGTVHRKQEDKDKGPIASAVVLRVDNVKILKGQTLNYDTKSNRPDPLTYIGYFASVSGNKTGVYRCQAGRYIDAGSAFTLRITARRPVDDALWAKLEAAVTAFCRLGSLGLRATRGFGQLAEAKPPRKADFLAWAATLAAHDLHLWEKTGPRASARKELCDALRALRHSRPDLGGGTPNALGFTGRQKRQASALRLCPVRVAEGDLPLMLYAHQTAKTQPDIAQELRAHFAANGFREIR